MKKFVIICLLSACNPLYQLPDPPPESERKDVSLVPKDEKDDGEKRYLAVRARVLGIYQMLADLRFQEATTALSQETRDFILYGGKEGATVADVLSSGSLKMKDGRVVEFDPVSTLLASDVSKLVDSVDGVKENETPTRKELFAQLPDGNYKRIVMIREGNSWVLHRTRLSQPFAAPSENAPKSQ